MAKPWIAPLINVVVKLAGDLFGNKTRSGITSVGLALVALLTAVGVNPQLAQFLGATGQCLVEKAPALYQMQQQDQTEAGGQVDGGSGGNAGTATELRQSRRHGADGHIHDGGSGALGLAHEAHRAHERPSTPRRAPVDASPSLSRWPWVGPPPLPAGTPTVPV